MLLMCRSSEEANELAVRGINSTITMQIIDRLTICPPCKHCFIIRKGDIFSFLIEHNLRSKLWNNTKRSFYPHLTHSIVIRNRVIRATCLDFQLTRQTFEEWMTCIVYPITIGMVKERYRNVLVKRIPLISIILTVMVDE